MEMDGYILVIDDDDDMRTLVTDVLQGIGRPVRCARDGREGLFYIQRTSPALIILDLCMPGMTGWDLVSQLREKSNATSVPLIVLTSFPLDDRLAVSLDLTPDRIVRKPDIITELPALVRQFMEQPHAAPESSGAAASSSKGDHRLCIES